MSYSIKEGILTVASAATRSMATAFVTDKLDCRYEDLAFIQASYTGSDAADASMTLESSLNGVSWDSYATSLTTLDDVGTGSGSIEKEKLGGAYIRISYDPGANTVGTISFKYLLKSSR